MPLRPLRGNSDSPDNLSGFLKHPQIIWARMYTKSEFDVCIPTEHRTTRISLIYYSNPKEDRPSGYVIKKIYGYVHLYDMFGYVVPTHIRLT